MDQPLREDHPVTSLLPEPDADATVGAEARHALHSVLSECKRVVVGQDAMLERVLVALLERLAGNLVENAIRHGRGETRLALRTVGRDAVLSVRNGGDPIPPDALRRLSQPFERLQGRVASGNGLGLSIVRAVAEAHGGTLYLAAPATGGLEAEVRLPALVTAR